MAYKFEEMINRIKTVKKEKKITNAMLAELSGVPYGTLNKILGMETREPSINAIIKIAIALGVSTSYIINGDPKITNNSSEAEIEHLKKYRALDERGKDFVDIVLDREYSRVAEKTYKIKIAARSGNFREKTITEKELEQLKNLPDVDDLK